MQEQVKALWKRCFHDSEEFTELYFQLRYNDEVNLALTQQGQVTAALQILPYTMTFLRHELPMGYISGACTHPDFRNQGQMSQLLTQAFEKMIQTGYAFTTLIPAEPWLFDYYARLGYARTFQQTSYVYHRQPAATNEFDTEDVLETTDSYQEEVACFMEEQYKLQTTCCILHPSADLQVVYASLRLDHGYTYLLRQKGQLKAVAFAVPADHHSWRIEELLAIDKKAEKRILQKIAEQLQLSQLTVLASPAAIHSEQTTSLGMARILQVHHLLQLHAQVYPELDLHLYVHDQQVPANTGYYLLQRGKCVQSKQPFTDTYLSYSIGELTAWLLNPQHPYMSLMLN